MSSYPWLMIKITLKPNFFLGASVWYFFEGFCFTLVKQFFHSIEFYSGLCSALPWNTVTDKKSAADGQCCFCNWRTKLKKAKKYHIWNYLKWPQEYLCNMEYCTIRIALGSTKKQDIWEIIRSDSVRIEPTHKQLINPIQNQLGNLEAGPPNISGKENLLYKFIYKFTIPNQCCMASPAFQHRSHLELMRKELSAIEAIVSCLHSRVTKSNGWNSGELAKLA